MGTSTSRTAMVKAYCCRPSFETPCDRFADVVQGFRFRSSLRYRASSPSVLGPLESGNYRTRGTRGAVGEACTKTARIVDALHSPARPTAQAYLCFKTRGAASRARNAGGAYSNGISTSAKLPGVAAFTALITRSM